MDKPPYDQRLAHLFVPALARLGISPNLVTGFTLVLAFVAAWLFAQGEPRFAHWAAGFFVLARFLDHFDGELARLTGKSSKFGYYFDYLSGALSYAALFLGMGIGLQGSQLGVWALVLGAAGAGSALISLFLNMGIDKAQDLTDGAAIGYPGFGGFELEDGIYLIAPITWLGFLMPFFTAAGIGASIYCLWSFGQLLRARATQRS